MSPKNNDDWNRFSEILLQIRYFVNIFNLWLVPKQTKTVLVSTRWSTFEYFSALDYMQTLTWDWLEWMLTSRSTVRSASPLATDSSAVGSRCGEKQACSHSVHVIIWTWSILSSLKRNILLRKSFTSCSLMASSSWRPCGGREGTLQRIRQVKYTSIHVLQ